MNSTLTTTAFVSLLFPSLTQGEIVFVLVTFIAAICVLFGIKPVVIMGATLLYAISAYVSFFGTHPILLLIVVLIAAYVRIIATRVFGLGDSDEDSQVTFLRILHTVLSIFAGRNDREPPRENT